MTKEQEILDFLEVNLFNPILQSPSTSERFKKATRGLHLRMKQRDAQGMIQYFWNTVVDTKTKQANYGRLLENEGFSEFEEVVANFRVRFKEL
ncbi:hypothetical protein [Desulfosporosinus sp. FKB]|uniref:hypothetical protein n=1 Tax=Desulfosporosinus sp. FKB TaxID=1969835 RepID=UPI000B4A033E|nr:hypothetical protein [Desulfosporosinus sp. FKB]